MQDEGAAGSHVLKSRLEELVKRWGRGEVSLKHIAGVSAQELHSIASQGYFFFLQGKLELLKVDLRRPRRSRSPQCLLPRALSVRSTGAQTRPTRP